MQNHIEFIYETLPFATSLTESSSFQTTDRCKTNVSKQIFQFSF